MIPLSRTLLAAASCATALCLAGPASAQQMLSVNFDLFKYQLVDLTPGDGIAPGISFYDSALTASAFSYDSPYGYGVPRTSITNTANSSISFTSHDSGSTLITGVSPTDGLALLYIRQGSANLTTSSLTGFTLAPNTQVTIEIRGILSELNGPGVNSSGSLTAIGRLYPNGGMTEYAKSLSTDAGEEYGMLSLVLGSGANAVNGSVEFRSELWAQVTPVPEPATTAMLIGGLGLVGALARRRAMLAA